MIHRIARAALVACLVGLPLAACSDFDPTDLFDNNIFNPKKPLPGERKELFPNGTPGVPQGVPQDLYRGYQQPGQVGAAQGAPAQGAAAQETAAPPSEPPSRQAAVNQGVTTDPRYAGAPEAAAPKPKPKPKPKPQVAAAPPPSTSKPTAITVNGANQNNGAASPWPDPPPPRSAAPTNSSGWPDPPPPSTYAH